jgi:hypothetical protein
MVSTCVGASGCILKVIELDIEGSSKFERVFPFIFVVGATLACFLGFRTRMEGPGRAMRGAGAPVDLFDVFFLVVLTMVFEDAQLTID